MTDTHSLRYPIGEFVQPVEPVIQAERGAAVGIIAAAPAQLRAAVQGLNDAQLDTVYRPGGWTIRQVVHHLPDSHMNSYVRLKLALTEDRPTIRAYDEAKWARLPDAEGPIAMSLTLLEALHRRFVYLFERLSEADWRQSFRHPEIGYMRVDSLAAMYAWHGEHHIAHITSLRSRMGW